jgi:hypothetical protein
MLLDLLQHLGGPSSMFFYVDSGHSRISVSTRQEAHCRRFLALMVGAPGCTVPAPPRGPAIDVFYIYGGHSRISVSTRHGACRRCFLALMVGALRCTAPAPHRGPPSTFVSLVVGAPGCTTPAPPRGPTFDVCFIDGGFSRISDNTSQGACHQCFLR